jgi:hypothetical protein
MKMRTAVLVGAIVVAASLTGVAQDEKGRSKPVRKGDTISVTGCLRGSALEATESDALEATGVLVGGMTFRLTGDKNLVKQLREKHDGKVVAVKGVLKSDLPQQSGQSRSVGKMRIAIGAPAPSPNSPEAESRRALPVLEVKSFDGAAATTCH